MGVSDGSEGRQERRYRCWTKARVVDEPGPPSRSARWVTSRRAWFNIYDDRIECGSWAMRFDQIEHSVVYEVRQMFIHGQVLELRLLDGASYQFGFNPWARPLDSLPFKPPIEKVELGWSGFSIAIRLAALAAVASALITRLS